MLSTIRVFYNYLVAVVHTRIGSKPVRSNLQEQCCPEARRVFRPITVAEWPLTGVLLSLDNTKANTLKLRFSLFSQSNRRPKMPPAFSFSATNLRSSKKFTD
jgi:hypothetical protein